jgi:hypothetical protein
MSAFNDLNTQSHNYVQYISVSPIKPYLPKEYVKMILEETLCQVDILESNFIPNKNINIPNYNFYEDPEAYYTGIFKVNKWHDIELANQVLNNLICDMSYSMTEYEWSIQKYDMNMNEENLLGQENEIYDNYNNNNYDNNYYINDNNDEHYYASNNDDSEYENSSDINSNCDSCDENHLSNYDYYDSN